jgi:hypothetical protein
MGRTNQNLTKANSVEETPRRCDADFAPPALKYPFPGCFPAEPVFVFSGTFRIEPFRREALNFLRVCSSLVIFHWSFHFVHSTERYFDGRGRRRVDSRKTSEFRFRPFSDSDPVQCLILTPAL